MDALPAHTVQLVLEYVSPLSDPLPPHLVSTPLRQRHHFLQISPHSPLQYLCWPSPDNAIAIALLDHLPPLSDLTSFPTRYISDPDSTFAHVQVSSDAQGLRMLFHWDGKHGWKYHDLRLMPFPSPSFPTPQESLASITSQCTRSPSIPSSLGDVHFNGGDDGAYWDAYGAAEFDPTPLPLQSNTDTVQREDAYWAQYASLQGRYFRPDIPSNISYLDSLSPLGSADSTMPSPLPTHRKLRPANSADDGFPSPNGPISDIPVDAIHPRRPPSRLEPHSPNTLAHPLSTVSLRKDIFSPIRDDTDSFQSPSVHPSPEETAVDSVSVTPPMPNDYFDASVISPATFKLDGVSPSNFPVRSHTEDNALTDSIKGLFYLWKAGRKGDSEETDRSVFLRIVQAALACE